MLKMFGRNDPASPAAQKPAEPVRAPLQHVPQPAREAGKVFDLKVITRPEEAPPYKLVLSGANAELAIRQEDRRVLALLAVEGENERDIAVVFTNRREDLKPYVHACERARHAGFNVVARFEASHDVISLFYDSGGTARSAVREYRGQMDNLIDSIIAIAVERSASDIHFQVNERSCDVKLRIHGDLMTIRQIRREEAAAISNALFVAADQDGKQVAFDEKAYQDASIRRQLTLRDGVKVDLKLRFASLVTQGEGWDIVLRILPQGATAKLRALPDLGYDQWQVNAFHTMIARPTGVIVLAGTTGSGKSTSLQTLCTMINARYDGKKVIRTIEDPPEYIIPGARQTPVVRRANEAEGQHAGFAKALKAAMRCDPDIIMVGEVRDQVTAKTLQQAVQTGHKVLTTVHAGDPFFAIDRLMDLGIERSVIGTDQFISGIVYQRLIPVLCQCCVTIDHVRETMSSEMLKRVNRFGIDKLRFRSPSGCEVCRGQGVSGRTVVAEMLVPDRRVQSLIFDGEAMEARAYWRAGLMEGDAQVHGRTALEQALEKMDRGLVSPVDVEHELGNLDSQEPREEVKKWYLERVNRRQGGSRH